jgi:uncharacterized radical SAM protein YgiQ
MMTEAFMPTSLAEGESYYPGFSGFDVVFITGDPYYDHPLAGVAILSRLLDAKGYRVGIIAQPQADEEFQACGRPKLFFCITSGLLDSMLANYTPMLRRRESVLVPERGLMVYTQKAKQLFPGGMTVLGGVEATTRRFTHFDYKENRLRRGILNDTKADLLLFGNAERSMLQLAERMKKIGISNPDFVPKRGKTAFETIKEALDLSSLDGAAFRIAKNNDADGLRALPSYEECVADKKAFNLLTATHYLNPDDGFVEPCGVGRLRHNRPSHPLTEEEMDLIYALPFTRELHLRSKNFAFNQKMVENLKTSVVLGRGCWGSCAFCVIPLVQGKNIARRSKESILKEIEALYIRGERRIADLTLPTINMYGSYCELYSEQETIFSPILGKNITIFNKTKPCAQQCVGCPHRKVSDELKEILSGVEELNRTYVGTSIELRSALRHDIILGQKELFREVMKFVTRLKIAPEHIADDVLKQMRKANRKAFDAFLIEFDKVNAEQGTKKRLVPYFVAGHPGCTMEQMHELKRYCDEHKLFANLTQVFTPTPGTLSTATYYTGENPLTHEEAYVPRTFREKKEQKNILVGEVRDEEEFDDENR